MIENRLEAQCTVLRSASTILLASSETKRCHWYVVRRVMNDARLAA